MWAYTHVEADHHSTALEFVNMLKKRDGSDEEAKRAKAAIDELRMALQGEPVELKKVDVPESAPLVRKRLLL